jgi:hypothetical protein
VVGTNTLILSRGSVNQGFRFFSDATNLSSKNPASNVCAKDRSPSPRASGIWLNVKANRLTSGLARKHRRNTHCCDTLNTLHICASRGPRDRLHAGRSPALRSRRNASAAHQSAGRNRGPSAGVDRVVTRLLGKRVGVRRAKDLSGSRRAEKRAQLRSETPDGVPQELYALSLGIFVIRSLMFEVARPWGRDVDHMSFVNCFRILPCRLPECDARSPRCWQSSTVKTSAPDAIASTPESSNGKCPSGPKNAPTNENLTRCSKPLSSA